MKKWLALMFVSAFVGSVASAQWLVYDFKASLKRLDAQLTQVKYSANVYDQKANTEAYLDSYTVASDSLKGYLQVPICIGCNDNGTDSSQAMASLLYIVRKDDKSKAIWKFAPEVSAGLFNKGVGVRIIDPDDLLGGPTSMKGLSQAWLDFWFPFEDQGILAPFGKFNTDYQYGFLGFGSVEGYIDYAGFGKAKLDSQSSVGVCGGSTSSACYMISTISGSLTGSSEWTGLCAQAPIWDICAFAGDPLGGPLTRATVNGSWSIKLNNKVSAAVNGASTDAAKEAILVDKLGGGELIGSSASED